MQGKGRLEQKKKKNIRSNGNNNLHVGNITDKIMHHFIQMLARKITLKTNFGAI